jgi:SAM-dependent methyltransferase
VNPEYEAVLERKRKRLFGSGLQKGVGLEFGPLSRPLVLKSQSSVFYVDHCSTEELIKKYPAEDHENIEGIVEIDFIVNDQPMIMNVGNKQYDFVVESHVIEHVPNLVRWLREVREVLENNGLLHLVVPDKRFTFDFSRNVTAWEEIKQAEFENRKTPGIRSILDHFIHVKKIDSWRCWDDYSLNYQAERFHDDTYIEKALEAYARKEYIDVHVTVFTPWWFFHILDLVEKEYGLFFELENFLTTQPHDLEFYVTLKKSHKKKTDWLAEAKKSHKTANWPKGWGDFRPDST